MKNLGWVDAIDEDDLKGLLQLPIPAVYLMSTDDGELFDHEIARLRGLKDSTPVNGINSTISITTSYESVGLGLLDDAE